MANVAKDFAQLISQSKSNKTGPYDTQATVKRVEGNTVWVSIPGGVDETPIDKTVNCTAGDKVQVRVSGGRAWITGNASAPPTDDTTAIKARTTANEAQVLAVDAKETADAVEGIAVNASTTATTAKTIAEGVNEHFWHDNTGAHVTEVTQEEWNDPADPNYHSGGNTLITTQGMAIRDGMTNLAQFGSTGAVIGQNESGKSRSEIGTSGMQIIQNVSGVDTAIANLGYGPGQDDQGGTSDAPYYTLGQRRDNLSSNRGNWSMAEGLRTQAKGDCSHAEGYGTYANKSSSHAEGTNTYASGDSSHSEGYSTIANGNYSHVEGSSSEANANYAHAQNRHTLADSAAQTALGKYNISDSADTYAVIIGNGTADNARSNALTVDWSGNVEADGDITDGSGNVLSAKVNASALASVATSGSYNDLSNKPTIPTKTSDLTNDRHFVAKGDFVISSHTTTNKAISGGSTMSAETQTFTKSGYYPLAISGWVLNGSNATNLTLVHLYISSQASGSVGVTYRIHNAGSSQSTSSNVKVYILWIKEN